MVANRKGSGGLVGSEEDLQARRAACTNQQEELQEEWVSRASGLEDAAAVGVADFDGVREERVARHRALAAAAFALSFGTAGAELNRSAGRRLAATGTRTGTIRCRERHLLAEVAGHGLYLLLLQLMLQFFFNRTKGSYEKRSISPSFSVGHDVRARP